MADTVEIRMAIRPLGVELTRQDCFAMLVSKSLAAFDLGLSPVEVRDILRVLHGVQLTRHALNLEFLNLCSLQDGAVWINSPVGNRPPVQEPS